MPTQLTNSNHPTKTDHAMRFNLADWYVDPGTNRLIRADREIKLETRTMSVLVYLAQHQNKLVTREEIEQAVWGNTIVGYEALTGCIAKLRKALEDDPRQPHFIETISKKGYRLLAPVTYENDEHDTDPKHTTKQHISWGSARQYRLVIASVIAITIITLVSAYLVTTNNENSRYAPQSDRPSIVVLPFTSLTAEPNQQYFSDGITADITTALSKLSGLFVIAQSSAIAYRNQPLDIKQVAGSLGVQYVLEGSVRRTHNRLRVNASLIDASSNIYLWSEKYDRELKRVFEVQDNITANIVNALSIKLSEEEQHRVARKYTTSLDAYEDFLRGQLHYARHTSEDNQLARDYYQNAIDRDAAFARAYSAMALTFVAEYRYSWGGISNEHLDKALQLAAQGVSIDNDLPQAHWVKAYVHVFRHQYDKASRSAGRAIALDPNFADSYLTLAICKIYFGAPNDALKLIRKAMLLNPGYPAAYASVLGQAYFFTGQYDKASHYLREAGERNQNLLTAHVFLITTLRKLGQHDEATWVAEQLRLIAPHIDINNVDEMLAIQNTSLIEEIKEHLKNAGL